MCICVCLGTAVSQGGCDINSGNTYLNHLLPGVNDTSLACDITDVNNRLFNAFRVRFRLGLFDPVQDQPYWTYRAADELGTYSPQPSLFLSFSLSKNTHTHNLYKPKIIFLKLIKT